MCQSIVGRRRMVRGSSFATWTSMRRRQLPRPPIFMAGVRRAPRLALAGSHRQAACLTEIAARCPLCSPVQRQPGRRVGHNWVKARYIDPSPPWLPLLDPIESSASLSPGCSRTTRSFCRTTPTIGRGSKRAALSGWSTPGAGGSGISVAGGMFDDVWKRDVHVIAPFEIPHSWEITRSFDWGSSKPFSVGWWAESDGTEAERQVLSPRLALASMNGTAGTAHITKGIGCWP